MNKIITVLSKEVIRDLSAAYLLAAICRYRYLAIEGEDSFIMPDLIGSSWPEALVPFYEMYESNQRVAGQQLGKVLKDQAEILGLRSEITERRGGKKITRYYF